ncbi:MAG: PTS sugar transporter subunit IIA [Planctomycetota bacterium]
MIQLNGLFTRDSIVVDLDAEDRDAATAELVHKLVDAGRLSADAAVDVLAALTEREKQGSTGFGKGVAVPHAKHAVVPEMMGAIGVSKAGIDFNSLDAKPVRTIVLLLSPADRSREHLDAMQTVFKVLQQDLLRRDLAEATSVDAVLHVLRQADGVPA